MMALFDPKRPVIELQPEMLSTPYNVHTNWHVITGAPCSGKTTLIDLLADKGFHIIPEPGRMYVEREIARGRTLAEIRAVPADFNKALNNLTLEIEAGLPPREVLFLDRGFPDGLAYAQMIGSDPNEILLDCFRYRYASVFILDRFPVQQDAARIEDDKTADFIDKWLDQDYRLLGYDVIRVPVLPPGDRVEYILNKIPGLVSGLSSSL